MNRREIQLVFITIFVVMVASAIFNPNIRPDIGCDFNSFRMGGTIVAEGAGNRLYDLEYQAETYRRLGTNLGPGKALPYLNPPMLAVLVAPLARLPLMEGYLIWAGLSVAFYWVGCWLIADRQFRAVALAVAFAFQPFAIDTLLTGQVSAIVFIGVALAIWCERTGRYASAGAALALCAVKPPTMIWIVPMLFVRGRYRTLAGLAGGLAIAGLISLGAGARACLDFTTTLFRFGRSVSVSGVAPYQRSMNRYVDLNTFLRVAHANYIAVVAGLALALLLVVGMIWIWRRGDERQAWAITLSITSVVNVYAPVYDSILIVIAAILLWSVASGRAAGVMLGILFVSAPISASLSYSHGWPQIYTVVLVAFAAFQLWIAWRRRTEI